MPFSLNVTQHDTTLMCRATSSKRCPSQSQGTYAQIFRDVHWIQRGVLGGKGEETPKHWRYMREKVYTNVKMRKVDYMNITVFCQKETNNT